MMLHIGTGEEDIMGEKKIQNRARIGWEIPGEMRKYGDGPESPMVISQKYTLSMNEKANLRKMLQSWRGKAFTEEEATAFDITKLLGLPCMLNIIHKQSAKGSTYANIAGVTAMPKGFEAPAQIHRTCVFDYDSPNLELLEALPDFMQEEIKASDEYKALMGSITHADQPERPSDSTGGADDLPF